MRFPDACVVYPSVFLSDYWSDPRPEARLPSEPLAGSDAPDNIAPRITGVLKSLHHIKVEILLRGSGMWVMVGLSGRWINSRWVERQTSQFTSPSMSQPPLIIRCLSLFFFLRLIFCVFPSSSVCYASYLCFDCCVTLRALKRIQRVRNKERKSPQWKTLFLHRLKQLV